jgi:uncharacterized membrane protein YebE (DUF533 family)
MKLISFSVAAGQATGPIAKALDSVPPPAAHAVGAGTGLTGLALYADLAKHLTTILGLVAAVLAVLGALFYAAYWALKTIQKWRELTAPPPTKKHHPNSKHAVRVSEED